MQKIYIKKHKYYHRHYKKDKIKDVPAWDHCSISVNIILIISHWLTLYHLYKQNMYKKQVS